MIIRIDELKNTRVELFKEILNFFTRDQLRRLAKEYGIPYGRTKGDTIDNIITCQADFNETIRIEIY